MNINEQNSDFLGGMLVGMFITTLFLIGMIFGNNADWKNSCIRNGVGRYDDKTAEFKFIPVEDIKRVEVDE